MACKANLFEDEWKKIVARITIKANSMDNGPTTLEMYIDRRDEIIFSGRDAIKTLENIRDMKLQADIQLAIYFFKVGDYDRMVSKCKEMLRENSIALLEKHQLI